MYNLKEDPKRDLSKWVVDTSVPKLQFSFIHIRHIHTQLEMPKINEKPPFSIWKFTRCLWKLLNLSNFFPLCYIFKKKPPLFWHVYPFNLLYKGEQAPCSRPFIWLLNLNDYKGLMILLDLIHGVTITKIAFLCCCLVGFFL